MVVKISGTLERMGEASGLERRFAEEKLGKEDVLGRIYLMVDDLGGTSVKIGRDVYLGLELDRSVMRLTNGNAVLTSQEDVQSHNKPCYKEKRLVTLPHISASPSNEVNEVYRKLYKEYTRLILESLWALCIK